MLDNIFIENVMRSINGFSGVYSSNNAPLLSNCESMIINFDNVKEPGSHFVALYLDCNNICYYFDSLNFLIIPKNIENVLKKYTKVYDVSRNIQSYSSSYCGFFCMLFIVTMINGNWNNVVNKFNRYQRIKNDELCIKLLCKNLKKLSKNVKK